MTNTATETLSVVAKRTSKKSAKVAKKAAAKRVAAKAAKPQRSVAKSSARNPTKAAAKELPAHHAVPKAEGAMVSYRAEKGAKAAWGRLAYLLRRALSMASKTKPKAAKRPTRAVNEKPAATKPKGAAGKGERSTATKSKAPLVGAKPTLLAGGNPQIAKADGDAPVQAYIAAMPGWKRDVGRRLNALIVRTVPNVRKAVRWNSPFYGIEGQGWFLNFHCFTKYVKVAFFRGTSLRPVPPGESKHKDTRYLDIHEDDQLDEELVASWIRQASELPGWVP